MTDIDSLYKQFDVSPACTDNELRIAYRRTLLRYHPDRNPDQIESATIRTQQLTAGYAELKMYRVTKSLYGLKTEGGENRDIPSDGINIQIHFSFSDDIDLDNITERKTAFKNEWENLRKNPSNPFFALRLLHAAFRAERHDSVSNLLLNPILIDSAPYLFSLTNKNEACETLVRWAEVLKRNNRTIDAVQILEDAVLVDKVLPSILDVLRRLHYQWAQYKDPTTGIKATPKVRIEHLNRILELGFNYDYIYKRLAEAYHECGDDEKARVCLNQAYSINPGLLSAVRISQALGFKKANKPPRQGIRPSRKYKFSHSEQIPTPSKIYDWEKTGNWDSILEYANPNDYSPRIVSKARKIFNQIACSLRNCNSPKAIDVLFNLLNFYPYWDVKQSTITSLSLIGDKHTLELLEKYRSENPLVQTHLVKCLSYLRARFNNQFSLISKDPPEELYRQAQHFFKSGSFGEARLLVENLLMGNSMTTPLYFNATILLACSCAKMGDTRAAIDVIYPIFNKISEKAKYKISRDVASWLWNDLVFQEYRQSNDEYYQLALKIHFNLIETAETPDKALESLRRLTRWLELLGVGHTAQWIRQLIRNEAPGTWYVDQDNHEQYIHTNDLSKNMQEYLNAFDKDVKSTATARLKVLMKTPNAIDDAKFLLDEQ